MVEEDHNYFLGEYVFLLLWLTSDTVFLAYLGLADSALVKQKLDELEGFSTALAMTTTLEDKEKLLVSCSYATSEKAFLVPHPD